jgi:hypothetical protein
VAAPSAPWQLLGEQVPKLPLEQEWVPLSVWRRQLLLQQKLWAAIQLWLELQLGGSTLQLSQAVQ